MGRARNRDGETKREIMSANWNAEFDEHIRPTLYAPLATHTRIPSRPGNTPDEYANDGRDGYPVYPRYVAPVMQAEPPEFPVSPIVIALALLVGGWVTFSALYLGALWLIDNIAT